MKCLFAILIFCSCTTTEQLKLDGSKSFDPDGYIVKYEWRQIEGQKLNFKSAFVRPVMSIKKGVYKFELTVTDNQGAIDKDTVTIKK